MAIHHLDIYLEMCAPGNTHNPLEKTMCWTSRVVPPKEGILEVNFGSEPVFDTLQNPVRNIQLSERSLTLTTLSQGSERKIQALVLNHPVDRVGVKVHVDDKTYMLVPRAEKPY